MLTLSDVATRLGISADSVRRLIDAGRLEAVNVSAGQRKRWRVDPAALERFVEAQRNEAPEPIQRRPREYRSRWLRKGA